MWHTRIQENEGENQTSSSGCVHRGAAAICGDGAGAERAGTGDSNAELRREIEDQKQRLLVLERKLEIQQEAATAAAATAPRITANASRFQIGSTDNSNFIRFRGTLFADNRAYAGDSAPETADTFLLRSVRPTFEGTFGGIYDFRFTPDFGSGRSTIVDAYAAARFKPGFVVTVGKFKPSVGLERLASRTDLRFMERGLPTFLVPNRDLGVQLSGDFAGGAFAYQVGYFNGVTDGQSSDNLATPDVESDTGGDYAARVFFQPFINSENFNLRGLGFGVGSTWQDLDGAAANPYLPSYRSQGQLSVFSYRANTATGVTPNNATFSNGERLRLAPQLYYYRGSFGFLGEYTTVKQDVSRTVAGVTRSDTLTNSRVAGTVLLVPDRRGRKLPRLHAGQHLPARQDWHGRVGTRRANPGTRRRRRRVRGWREFLRQSADRDHARKPRMASA